MKSWNGLDDAAAPVQPRRTHTRWRALSATFVTLIILAGLDTIFPGVKHWDGTFLKNEPASHYTVFDWSETKPNDHLTFHKCFGNFECAKLSVPFDYFNGTYSNDTVSIAIVKLPAKVPVDDPRYGGPILLNPGGPGGSGISFALNAADRLQAIVDSGDDPRVLFDDAKYFDLIGFDPRGIGLTEPAAQCMPDQPASWSWNLREESEGILGSSDAALGRLWSMTHAYGSSCKLAEEEMNGPDIKQYMSTASVARDMLEIAEKHAEYNAKKTAELVARKAGKHIPCHNTLYKPGEAKLQYWGFSYGTYLGSTFASLFPDRVGRVILDGVVSTYDYNHSLGNGSLTDNEKAMSSFFTYCHNEGPDKCPLAAPDSSIDDIKERFHNIVDSLYHDPLAYASPEGPEVFTWSVAKLIIFSSNYQPVAMFPFVAELLHALESGGGDIIDNLILSTHYAHIYSCPINGSASDTPSADPGVPGTAILCGDGVDQSHMTKAEFTDYWQFMDTQYPTSGSGWSALLLQCTAWKIKASYTFQGPFGGKTSNPILFISNTADPVTPLRSGRYMHNLFPDSGLLVGDYAGHCSIASPNICTLNNIRRYFQTGQLPLPDTVCVPPPSSFSLNSTDPKSPFYDPSLGTANVVALQHDQCDRKASVLQNAAVEVQKALAGMDLFGMRNVPGGRMARTAMDLAVTGSW